VSEDKRRYRRLQAPVYCRPAGLRARVQAALGKEKQRIVQNISTGGVRIYTDDRYKVGERLELEVLLPDKSWITVDAHIVWITELPDGGPARYDVGLEFAKLAQKDAERIAALIED
jgi:Tfp pilus assembly protein PilZ